MRLKELSQLAQVTKLATGVLRSESLPVRSQGRALSHPHHQVLLLFLFSIFQKILSAKQTSFTNNLFCFLNSSPKIHIY